MRERITGTIEFLGRTSLLLLLSFRLIISHPFMGSMLVQQHQVT